MVDPRVVTDYNRSDAELEEFLLFCIAVTGKTAVIIARQLEDFLTKIQGNTPYEKLRRVINANTLNLRLKSAKIGQYTRLTKAYTQIVDINPRTCTIEDLEAIHGIGPKTARYFLLHSRKDQRIIPLDTHMIHYLRENGHTKLTNTPSSRKEYMRLEQIAISEADKAGKSPADFDLAIWNKYSKFGKKD